MKARILLVCVLLAAPAYSPGASKEILELQRDIAQLQQQIKDMQRSQDEKFASLIEVARQSVEAANRANTGVAVIQSNLEKTMRAIQDSVSAPMAGQNSRLNEISNNIGTLTQAVSDLTSMLNRMQTQLTDVNQKLATMQAQPIQPPTQTGGTGQPTPAVSTAPCPTGSATASYDAALKDYRGGKAELGVTEFGEFLRCFGNTELAPNAQFYIAQYHYGQHDYETAVREYDIVLEKYPNNNKTPEALLYKGQALAQIGRRTDAAAEWKDLIGRFPRAPEAKTACDNLKAFGVNCPTTASSAPGKKGSAVRKK
jgi:tol-pal system protein YbgF